MANEILYALNEARSCSDRPLSKLSIQKLLYLSGALAPIKDVILAYLSFITLIRGPYSKDIQNTLDHLVAIGLVEIVSFEKSNKAAYVNYQIAEAGKDVVKLLREYVHEDEKYWWISLVTKLVYTYFHAEGLEGNMDDKIKALVYQDPTYRKYKDNGQFHHLIELGNPNGLTYQLIDFIKEYFVKERVSIIKQGYRRTTEIILLTFFEYLYLNHLSEQLQK